MVPIGARCCSALAALPTLAPEPAARKDGGAQATGPRCGGPSGTSSPAAGRAAAPTGGRLHLDGPRVAAAQLGPRQAPLVGGRAGRPGQGVDGGAPGPRGEGEGGTAVGRQGTEPLGRRRGAGRGSSGRRAGPRCAAGRRWRPGTPGRRRPGWRPPTRPPARPFAAKATALGPRRLPAKVEYAALAVALESANQAPPVPPRAGAPESAPVIPPTPARLDGEGARGDRHRCHGDVDRSAVPAVPARVRQRGRRAAVARRLRRGCR